MLNRVSALKRQPVGRPRPEVIARLGLGDGCGGKTPNIAPIGGRHILIDIIGLGDPAIEPVGAVTRPEIQNCSPLTWSK